MKTSNKLMLSALVVLLVTLTMYNFTLKSAFDSGKYKSPYAGYVNKNINDFNEIQVDAINMMHVTIKQGDYGVYIQENLSDSVKVTREGKRLVINIDFAKKPASDDVYAPHYNDIVITCPQLHLLITDEHRYANPLKKPLAEGERYMAGGGQSVNLKKFILDSLTIQQNAGTIDISASKIGLLRSTTLHKSILNVRDDTDINQADFHINDRSWLTLEKFNIPHFNYTLADSATITLSSKGALLKDVINKL